jgi:hypothetical protein
MPVPADAVPAEAVVRRSLPARDGRSWDMAIAWTGFNIKLLVAAGRGFDDIG